MIRICPERDGRCPHGMDCQFAIDRGSCDMAGSRASLSVDREREHAKPRAIAAQAICAGLGDDWDREGDGGLMEAYGPTADAVLKALISHGWITDLGLEAMKKERGME